MSEPRARRMTGRPAGEEGRDMIFKSKEGGASGATGTAFR